MKGDLFMTQSELEKEIYKTASMGEHATESMLAYSQSAGIKRSLTSQLNQYRNFKRKIESGNQIPQATSSMKDRMLKMGVKMNLMMDSTPSHMAKMMIQGSNMGIIDLQSALNQHPEAPKEQKQLAQDMISFEQQTIEAYKKYL